jgi:dUTP pyrophosphatase
MSEEHNEFVCSECGRTFKNSGALRLHIRVHDKTEEATPSDTEENATIEVKTVDSEYNSDTMLDNKFIPVVPAQNRGINVLIKRLPHYDTSWPDIKRATPESAGFDIRAAIPDRVCIGINKWLSIPTGICMALPPGYVAFCCPRSGLAKNKGITVLNSPGVVDSDYRGELLTILVNNTTSKYWVEPGDRVAQLVIIRLVDLAFKYVENLPDSIRGESGFGSSGSF